MASPVKEPLSPRASALLDALRAWAARLAESVVVREDRSSKYGGLLFELRPARSDSMKLTVGLGNSDGVDIFWGGGYRWEDWKATHQEVLEVCEAVRHGEVMEETWTLGPVVIEKRCSIGLNGRLGGDGSGVMPLWLKRWARVSRRSFAPWGGEAA